VATTSHSRVTGKRHANSQNYFGFVPALGRKKRQLGETNNNMWSWTMRYPWLVCTLVQTKEQQHKPPRRLIRALEKSNETLTGATTTSNGDTVENNDDDATLVALVPTNASTSATTSGAALHLLPICLSTLPNYNTNGVQGLGPAEYQAAIVGLVHAAAGADHNNATVLCAETELPTLADLQPLSKQQNKSRSAWRQSFDAATCHCPTSSTAASNAAATESDETKSNCCSQDVISLDAWTTIVAVCHAIQAVIQQQCTSVVQTSSGASSSTNVTKFIAPLVETEPPSVVRPRATTKSPTAAPFLVPTFAPTLSMSVGTEWNGGALPTSRSSTVLGSSTTTTSSKGSSAAVHSDSCSGPCRALVYIGLPILVVVIVAVIAVVVWYDYRERRLQAARLPPKTPPTATRSVVSNHDDNDDGASTIFTHRLGSASHWNSDTDNDSDTIKMAAPAKGRSIERKGREMEQALNRMEQGMSSSSTWTHSPMRVVATVSHAANHTPPIKQHCLNDLLRSLHLGGDLDDPTDHRLRTIECSPQPSHNRVQKFAATTSRLEHEIREEDRPRERVDSASLRSLSSWSETTDLVFHDEEDSIQSDRTPIIHNHPSTTSGRSSSSSTAKMLLSTWAPSAGMAVRRLPPKSSTSTWRPMSPSSLGTKQTRPKDDDSPPPDVTETASTSSSSSPDSNSSDDGHEDEVSPSRSNLTRREDSGPLDELFLMEQVSL
jgi:hypothetical protein